MSSLMKNFFSELIKSTTFTGKVTVVKTTLQEWLYDQVYPDAVFKNKLQQFVSKFISNQFKSYEIYNFVEAVDSANKLSPHQIDFLFNAILNNYSVKLILQRFTFGEYITDDELSLIATFLVTEMDRAYQLPYC
ncbi:ac75 [Oxyplax ochracea nucleopolyhedrovirus]|uniref:Ac75 n=1 Tax=Oxyplax ochracea nucleopolyhedrovirus TaxID=2083176 RepID=A0A2L0WU42_9ABAC|nr:ac75 [Oxyplax ochracea nucleopolyhedrovirus]AVA31162.1 ac75 [Oxyplax ochracea nucleopolyhedrovirus]